MTVLPNVVTNKTQFTQQQSELLDYLRDMTVELSIMADNGGLSEIAQAYREALTEIKAIG